MRIIASIGRQWPKFLRHLHEIILKQSFKECKLQLPVDERKGQVRCVTPKCQCSSFERRDEGDLVEVVVKRRSRKKRLLLSIKVQVPRWVARTSLPREKLGRVEGDLVTVHPRYHSGPISRLPRAMTGVHGLYKSTPLGGPRCVASLHDPFVCQCLDAGLSEMNKLLSGLMQEYSQYWGPVGLSTAVADLRCAMVKAFDWHEYFSSH